LFVTQLTLTIYQVYSGRLLKCIIYKNRLNLLSNSLVGGVVELGKV